MGRFNVRWAGPLFVVGMVACDEATGPEADFEVYELVEVAGQELPATIVWSPGYAQTYLSDVIRIFEDGRWDRTESRRVHQPDRPEQELTSTSDGTLLQDGAEVVLSYECHDTGTCVAPDRLRFVDGGAVIERWVSQDSTLVWRYRLAGGEAVN